MPGGSERVEPLRCAAQHAVAADKGLSTLGRCSTSRGRAALQMIRRPPRGPGSATIDHHVTALAAERQGVRQSRFGSGMKRDSLITPSRLILLMVGLLLLGAVLWTGLRPSRHERRQSKPAEAMEPAPPSLPPAGSSPIADLKKSNAALKKALMYPSPSSSPEFDSERGEMRRIVRIVLGFSLPADFEGLVRRSLAGHWNDINADQRTEFVGVVRALIARNLSKQLYELPDYDLRFIKETVTGSEASVDATVEFPYQGKRARVVMAWKLVYKRGSWLAYDLIVDDQSMLENYRAEFDRIITTESFDVLIGRMKRRLEKPE